MLRIERGGAAYVCEVVWTYTTGLVDAKAGAQLSSVGLPDGVSHSALDEAGKRMRGGVDLSVGRYSDLIANLDCEFRPVAQHWVRTSMPRADWYCERAEYPMLRLVYPNLQNRFPDEADFDRRIEQPRLQPDIVEGKLEKDFRTQNEESGDREGWPFPDPMHTQVFLTKTIFDGVEGVTYVSHNADKGAWQLLGESMSAGGGPVRSCLHQPVDRDPTLLALADLPKGWYAERNYVGAEWVRRQ